MKFNPRSHFVTSTCDFESRKASAKMMLRELATYEDAMRKEGWDTAANFLVDMLQRQIVAGADFRVSQRQFDWLVKLYKRWVGKEAPVK